MSIAKTVITTVSNAQGAGTVSPTAPVSGDICEVRVPTAAFTGTGGTTNFTITRVTDGGTIMVANNRAAPFAIELPQFSDGPGVPCSDRIQVVYSGAAVSQPGTLFLYARR